jgi:hypothetical protein
MDAPALMSCWNRLRTALKRRGLLGEYFTVHDVRDGRLHLHVVIVGGRFLPRAVLDKQVPAAGFGPVFDVRMGGKVRGLARYVTKGLATLGQRIGDRCGARLRPCSHSRDWPAQPARLRQRPPHGAAGPLLLLRISDERHADETIRRAVDAVRAWRRERDALGPELRPSVGKIIERGRTAG